MKLHLLAATAALALAAPATAANLVFNSSFETGDFTGWTQIGDTSFTGVDGFTAFGVTPTDGAYYAYFGPVSGEGGITQDVATAPSGNYFLSFDLNNFGGSPTSERVSFDGTDLFFNTDAAAHPFQRYTFAVTASGFLTTVSFQFFQEPRYYLLDNVTLSVPEAATWAMMIAGFGLVGGAMRRRAALTA